jgi:F-type H+-transporting ATPase subunit alpha
MKQVAGSLKLELAQYREVESFSALASELDDSTKHTLSRGARLIELLKQTHSQPEPLMLQVISIFAGMNGYLDSLDISNISAYKKSIVSYYESSNLIFDTKKKLNNLVLNQFFSSIKSN